jgi:hypothetical protein
VEGGEASAADPPRDEEPMTYTKEQIRAAFWAQFHKSGEIFFGYLGTDEENEDSTNSHWTGLEEELEKASDATRSR